MCVLSIELVWVEIYGKMGEKTTISGHFRGLVPVPNSVVPVPYWFWSTGTGTGTERLVLVPNVLFWTSVSVLAITWSFLIRFV